MVSKQVDQANDMLKRFELFNPLKTQGASEANPEFMKQIAEKIDEVTNLRDEIESSQENLDGFDDRLRDAILPVEEIEDREVPITEI